MFNSSSVILWSHSSSTQEFFLISFVFVYHCDYIYRKIIIVLKGRVEINSVGDPVWAPRIRKENVNTVATPLNIIWRQNHHDLSNFPLYFRTLVYIWGKKSYFLKPCDPDPYFLWSRIRILSIGWIYIVNMHSSIERI